MNNASVLFVIHDIWGYNWVLVVTAPLNMLLKKFLEKLFKRDAFVRASTYHQMKPIKHYNLLLLSILKGVVCIIIMDERKLIFIIKVLFQFQY